MIDFSSAYSCKFAGCPNRLSRAIVLATLTKAMTMNFRLERIIPSFALFLAVGCGARSPLDVLDNESAASTGGIGGDLGEGGTSGPFGGGGRPGSGGAAGSPTKGGSPTAGGYYYSSGGYSYYSSGGYYYSSSGGSYYSSSGGYYYNSGGSYYYSSGGYARGGSLIMGGSSIMGGRIATGGSNSGGSGGHGGTPIYGGTQSSGGIPNAGGSAGGSAGSIRVDGGFGGGGGSSIKPDAYVFPDGVGSIPETGSIIKLDGALGTDTSTCQGLASNEELIDDLNDGDRFIPMVNGRVGAWTDGHDASPSGKMYPDPNTGFVPTDTGDVCRKFAAYVAGTGYVITGAEFWFGLGSPYNASKYTGISFWAKIDAGTSPGIRVDFPDKDTDPDGNICQAGTCWDHYGYRLTLTPTWTKYTVSFSQLTQDGWGHLGTAFDPSTLYQIEFAIPVNATFGFWIDDVAFTM